jgi:hypothetical protein
VFHDDPRHLHQSAILHPGGAGCLTRPANQTQHDVRSKSLSEVLKPDLALGSCSHQRNAPPGTIHLRAEHRIGRTCLQAQTTVDALPHFALEVLRPEQFKVSYHT